MKSKIVTLLVLISLSLTSCATIMHGTHQTIGISSNPSNAFVSLDGQYLGNTPIVIGMARRDNHYLKIDLPGYMPFEATFTRQLSVWVFGNIIFGGFIGLAVDALTGAIFALTPDQIHAELRNNGMTYSNDEHDAYIAVVLKSDPSWKKIGQLEAQ